MNFNEKLISLRKSKGLSQEELGGRIECVKTNSFKMGKLPVLS